MDYEKQRTIREKKQKYIYRIMLVPERNGNIREWKLRLNVWLGILSAALLILAVLSVIGVTSLVSRQADRQAMENIAVANQEEVEQAKTEVQQWKTQAEQLRVQVEQLTAVQQAAEQAQMEMYLPKKYPLEGSANVLHTFGAYEDENGEEQICYGLELQAAEGTFVCAAGSGTVILAGEDEELGNTVKIDHGNGYISLYIGCDDFEVEVGEQIEQGDEIASLTSEGDGQGKMDYRVILNGEYVDPQTMMDIVG